MQLVQFNQSANVVTTTSKFGTTVRLQSAKEYKGAHGLKGQAGRKAYNDYLREQGKASTVALVTALAQGTLLVRSARDSKSSVGVNFIKASAIKDPVRAAEPTEAELCAKLGIAIEDYQALKLAKRSK